jgi:hypothetical protein
MVTRIGPADQTGAGRSAARRHENAVAENEFSLQHRLQFDEVEHFAIIRSRTPAQSCAVLSKKGESVNRRSWHYVLARWLVLFWICGTLMSETKATAATVPLPMPNDVPAGPEGVAGPGGIGLPPLAGEATADAPAISAISDVTFPDETLVVTGDKLAESQLRIWMEGRLEDLPPLRVAHNRMQAVVPKDWPTSTMLVWPIRGQQAGTPIRVNGTTLWWSWPCRIPSNTTANSSSVLLLGKNLQVGSSEPRVYLHGPQTATWLTVLSAQPYQLAVQLPKHLSPGTYRIFAHNGSGGPYGWSEAVGLEVFPETSQTGQTQFEVAEFGAEPDDGKDDAPAIQQAVDAAIKAEGGTVRFATGTYHLSHTINLPDVPGSGVQLVGAGMGSYEGNTETAGGPGTVLRFLPKAAVPKCLVHIDCRFGGLRDLTLIGGHEGIVRAIHDRMAPSQVVVRVTQHDVTIERVRVVMLDLRPQVPPENREDRQIYDAALHLAAAGRANLAIRECEFHSAGAGIQVGDLGRGHTDDGFPDPSTDYVAIEKCIFRGYSPGFYKEPAHPASYQHMGIFNEGVQVFNGKYLVIRGCDFAGADRRGGKMMNRSICVCNTSVRDLYIADNHSHDVGMVCPREDRVVNQGEQILFHFMYPHGGYFDVLDAGSAEVAVNPEDPRNAGTPSSPHMAFDRAGSRVLDEVGTNDHWVVFVSAGKGVGQYRVVVAADRKPNRALLRLDRPWRVVPDPSSRITLTTANRQNIVVGNTIDAGWIDSRCKVAGILFWFNGFENVIAGNTLRNLGYGIGFNSGFRNPCCWNLIRDNVMERMGGMAVESVEPAFYFDSCRSAGGPDGPLFQADSNVAGWYSVGNVARSNRGQDSPAAAFVHALTTDDGARQLPHQEQAGVVMPVVENSRFTGVKRGIVINRGAIWPALRGNVVETLDSRQDKREE